MAICPVCGTALNDQDKKCRICLFDAVNVDFLHEKDMLLWKNNVVKPYRKKYWNEKYSYLVIENDIVISNKLWNGDDIFLEIPYGILGVGNSAFKNVTQIIDITFPKTIKFIGDYAFENCQLSLLEKIPEGIVSIGNYAFSKTEIHEVLLPSNLKKLGFAAFSQSINMKKIEIPGSIKTVAPHSFYGCENLENVIVQSGVKIIGEQAFANCHDLQNVIIPSSIEEIHYAAFAKDIDSKIKSNIYCDFAAPSVSCSLAYEDQGITPINGQSFSYDDDYKYYDIYGEGFNHLPNIFFKDDWQMIGDVPMPKDARNGKSLYLMEKDNVY